MNDEMPLGMLHGGSPRNRVLDGRAHWRRLANTVERLCAAAIRGSAIPGVATRPDPRLLWAILLILMIMTTEFRDSAMFSG